MSELGQFEQLVKRARQETPPAVDVAADVVASVSVVPVTSAGAVDRMAVLFAAASVLAASIVALTAWRLLEQPMLAEVPNPFVVPVMVSQ
jgi:hypothetical protein